MTVFRSIALFTLSLCTLTGCAAVSLQSSPLPDGFAVKNLAKVDADGPFAVSRTGTIAAMSQGTLQVIVPSGGPGRSIAKAPATDLSFSPDGDRLAAAFATPTQSLLQLFDLQGKVLAEALVPGRITALSWRSEKELLATALQIRKHSFGSELISTLFRWDTVAPPVATLLNSVTARPQVAKLPEEILYKSLNFAVSPYGDEIAYGALKDPPLFTPYLRITIRHLESGAERLVAETGIGSGGPIYQPDGESLLVGDRRAMTRRIAIPAGKETDAWPTAGDRLALSPSGSYLLIDGRLFQGGREIASFPTTSTAAFLPDGSGIAISHEGTLFLVTGLNDPPAPRLPGDLARTRELRRLLALGLITDKEFKARKAKAPAP